MTKGAEFQETQRNFNLHCALDKLANKQPTKIYIMYYMKLRFYTKVSNS